MARALLALTLLAASLPVGLPLSSFASECGGGMIVRNESYKEIHVLGFIPCSQNGNVSGCPVQPDLLESSTFDLCCWVKDIPILAMTLDQINSDPTLLPGYRLVLDYVKSGVSRTFLVSLRAFVYSLLVCSRYVCVMCMSWRVGVDIRCVWAVCIKTWRSRPRMQQRMG